jgi:hypothetical protein
MIQYQFMIFQLKFEIQSRQKIIGDHRISCGISAATTDNSILKYKSNSNKITIIKGFVFLIERSLNRTLW